MIAKNRKAIAGFHGVLNFVVGLVLACIGLAGFVLIGWYIHKGRDPFDWFEFAILALSTAALVGGAKAIRFAIRCFLPAGVPLEEVSPQAAQMLEGRVVHDSTKPAVVLAWLLVPAVILSSFLALEILRTDPEAWSIVLFPAAFAAVLVFGGGPLFLRGRKFGKSICRLKTRQAVIGGAFEAAIEVEFPGIATGLPDLPEGPVEVELMNVTDVGEGQSVLWRTTHTVPVHALQRSADGGLRIPVTIPISRTVAEKIKGRTLSDLWDLRVRAPYRGIDYASQFHVVVRHTECEAAGPFRKRGPLEA